jgi:hypothetical protein
LQRPEGASEKITTAIRFTAQSSCDGNDETKSCRSGWELRLNQNLYILKVSTPKVPFSQRDQEDTEANFTELQLDHSPLEEEEGLPVRDSNGEFSFRFVNDMRPRRSISFAGCQRRRRKSKDCLQS